MCHSTESGESRTVVNWFVVLSVYWSDRVMAYSAEFREAVTSLRCVHLECLVLRPSRRKHFSICRMVGMCSLEFLLGIREVNLLPTLPFMFDFKPSSGATGTLTTLLSLSTRPEVQDLVEKSATQCVGGTTLP